MKCKDEGKMFDLALSRYQTFGKDGGMKMESSQKLW